MGIKYKVNSNFFKKWGCEMAYVLGYFYADGSLTDADYLRGKYISVSSIDLDTIIRIKKYLKSEHKIVTCKASTRGGHERYLLRIGDHELYNDLIKLGLYPNKSLTVKFPNNIPNNFLSDFVRGHFDGDGCVYIWKSKGKIQPIILRKLQAIFTSGSRDFLEGLAQVLFNKLALNQRLVYKGHRSFELRYSTKDSVKLFKFLYNKKSRGLFLERKYIKFLEYFELRPQRVDIRIENIIKYQQLGHVVK